MRALGPESVSSFLKVVLNVVYFGLIGVIGLLSLAALLVLLLPADLEFWHQLDITTHSGRPLSATGPMLAGAMLALGVYLCGIMVIVGRLRRVFDTLTAGDPFHPDNIRRLRLIGAILAALELARYLFWGATTMLLPDLKAEASGVSFTAWFSVLVVFVLAEVFREGARLRREAELTI